MYEKAKVHLQATESHLREDALLIAAWDILVDFIYKGTEAQMKVNEASRPPSEAELECLDRHWKALKKVSSDITTPRGKLHQVSPGDSAEVALVQQQRTAFFGNKSPEQREADRKAPHDPNGGAVCKQLTIWLCESHRVHGLAAFQCDGEPCQFRQFVAPHEISYGGWVKSPDLQQIRVKCLAREGIQVAKLQEIKDTLKEKNLLSFEHAPRILNKPPNNNNNNAYNNRGQPRGQFNNYNRYRNNGTPVQTQQNDFVKPEVVPQTQQLQAVQQSSSSQNFLANGPPAVPDNTGGVRVIQSLEENLFQEVYKKNDLLGERNSVFSVS